MKALVSGQAGLAILLEKDLVKSVHVDAREPVLRSKTDIPYLLADATDVIELVETTADQAMAALDLSWRQDRSLHLFLILLDRDADDEARRVSAECLEELLVDFGTLEFLGNRLYSSSLPSSADLVGALLLAETACASRLAGFLEDLGEFQPQIRQHRAAWDALRPELFGGPEAKLEFGYVAVTGGYCRRIAQSAPGQTNDVLYACLSDPKIKKLARHREILLAWIPPVHAERKPRQSSDGHEEEGRRRSGHRHGREVAKPKRSQVVFENVNRQKDAIKQAISEGRLDRIPKYVDDLVEYQLNRSERVDVAKSLCDLAMHAKSAGAHEVQIQLAQRATFILPSDGWSHAQLADAFLCLGRYDEAFRAYKTAGEFGQFEIARNGRAEVLKALGRLDEALSEYDATAREFRHNIFARNGRAEVLKALGRLEEALLEYDAIAREFPNNVVARSGRAEVLKALGRLDEALSEYDATAREFPNDVVARTGRAEVLKALGRLDEALTEYDATAREFPHNVVARCGRAETLKALGRLDEALSEYDATAREFPNNVVARSGRAEVLKALGRLDEALLEYDLTAREFPHDVVARNGRAEALKALGRLEEALSEYDATAREFPNSVVARCGRAEVLKALGRLDEALSEYYATALKFPHNVVARCGRAEVLKALGRWHEAAREYERVLALRPSDRYSQTGMASVLVLLGRYQDALRLLPEEPPRTIDEWIAFHVCGMIALKRDDISSAVRIFQCGLQESPWHETRNHFRGALAVARLRCSEFSEAVEALADESAPTIELFRAHAFGGLGEFEKARAALARIGGTCMPIMAVLRSALTVRYVERTPSISFRTDDWVYERECELLLVS